MKREASSADAAEGSDAKRRRLLVDLAEGPGSRSAVQPVLSQLVAREAPAEAALCLRAAHVELSSCTPEVTESWSAGVLFFRNREFGALGF